MSKVLQERGFRSLPSSTEMNLRDHVKSISTTKSDSNGIRRIGSGPYAILDSQYSNIFSETVPFPRRLHALIDLGASVSVMPFSTYSNLGLGDLAHIRLTIELANRTIKHLRGIAENVLVRIGEAVNESFDPHFGDYIELNDLDMPLEPRMDQDNKIEPTTNEGIIVNEPTNKCCFKMKFSCMIGYKHVIADFLPTLSINLMAKHFYNSIIKDKGDHEGKNLARTLIDIPIFVRNFSIISGFMIIDDMGENVTSGVVLDMPFCKKFVSCQKIMEFARRDECEQIKEE
ncbi:transposon ty3-I gag-pol polyprotein [Tanacetum coccineum]